jgi:replication stress response regulator SDE2
MIHQKSSPCHEASLLQQLFVRGVDHHTTVVECTKEQLQTHTIFWLKSQLQDKSGIPVCHQRLWLGSHCIENNQATLAEVLLRIVKSQPAGPGSGAVVPCQEQDSHDTCVSLRLSLSLLGGKGGFGALLRGQGKRVGQKKTTDTSACRDLQGRRLRHVQAAKDLEQYLSTEQPSAADINRQFSALNQDDQHKKKKKQCRFGDACQYKWKCKFGHPSDDQKAVSHPIPVSHEQDADIEDGVFSEADMQNAIMQGLQRKRKRVTSSSSSSSSSSSADSSSPNSSSSPSSGSSSPSVSSSASSSKSMTLDDVFSTSLLLPNVSAQSKRRKIETVNNVPQDTDEKQNSPVTIGDQSGDQNSDVDLVNSSEEVKSKPLLVLQPIKEVKEANNATQAPVEFAAIDLTDIKGASELEAFGLEHLKHELLRVGLKVGGTLAQRAGRLFLLKDTPYRKLPRKVRSKAGPTGK